MDINIDLHIHTHRSVDGLMTPAAIFETARRRGLHGVALTDHNTVEGALEGLGMAPRDLVVIPGAEYTTERGHMLALFITRGAEEAGIEARDWVYPFDEIAAFVRGEGGLFIAAHPFRGGESPSVLERLGSLDGIEIFNGRNAARRRAANDRARALHAGRPTPFTAGSDAHARNEIGSAYRVFDFPDLPGLGAVREALRAAHGDYVGGYSPITGSGKSELRRGLKHRDGRRILKSVAKLTAGAAFDLRTRLAERAYFEGERHTV